MKLFAIGTFLVMGLTQLVVAPSELYAQQPITFTNVAGGQTNVSEFDTLFGQQLQVAIDQLGTSVALAQNNDTFGVEIFQAGPVVGLEFVALGDALVPDPSVFDNSTLDLQNQADTGTPAFIGFLTDTDQVGYFQVSFDDPDGGDFNGTVTYLSGELGFSGASVVVGPSIPEPSSAVLVALLASAPLLRRRR